MAADWLNFLTEHVEAEWKEYGFAVLLSRVPSLLERGGFEPEAILQGRKLRPLLEVQAAEQLKLVQSEINRIIWGIVPANAQLVEPYHKYFRRATADRPVRFAPAVWRAFTAPIDAGRRRWLFSEPTVHFDDRSAGDPGDGGYEVPSRSIMMPENNGGRSDHFSSKVTAAIYAWANESSVDVSQFSLGRRSGSATKPGLSPQAGSVPSSASTALDRLLELLQPAEMTRISLPLDVIARLRSAKLNSGA